jgi:diaminohydroxyphosphoribosylaminopyrimidine deaminase/5-amino-6-(5-phosphoribosylamino)uracil reductase
MADAIDARFMARALQLADRGLYTTDPNPRVGCVIARDGVVVGEGWHERAGEPHAEVHALRVAGERARDATAYVTLEPCSHHGRTPPCADALIDAGVARVVAATEDPNPRVAGQGVAKLRAAGIAVEIGLLQAEAEKRNPGFFARMRRGRPYVRVKLAASLDGRTAMANGESKWITDEAARQDVQDLRARSSAVMSGIGTVLADDPRLDVRAFALLRQPLRVIVDPRLETPITARLLAGPGASVIVTANPDPRRAEQLREAGADVLFLPSSEGRVDLSALLGHLAQRQVNELLVESGPGLAGALVGYGLVDELVLYLAPVLLGDDARGLVHIPGLSRLADRIALDIVDVRSIGRDWRIIARPLVAQS